MSPHRALLICVCVCMCVCVFEKMMEKMGKMGSSISANVQQEELLKQRMAALKTKFSSLGPISSPNDIAFGNLENVQPLELTSSLELQSEQLKELQEASAKASETNRVLNEATSGVQAVIDQTGKQKAPRVLNFVPPSIEELQKRAAEMAAEEEAKKATEKQEL